MRFSRLTLLAAVIMVAVGAAPIGRRMRPSSPLPQCARQSCGNDGRP